MADSLIKKDCPDENEELVIRQQGAMKTFGFQETVYGMQWLLAHIDLNKRCRVVIDYDPDARDVSVDTYSCKSDDGTIQGRFFP